jgi:AbiV family abortive infection protein
MARKHFELLIPNDKAREGALLAATNARRLLTFAMAGAHASHFGPACSLCVLACEEAAKAVALLHVAASHKPAGIALSKVFSHHGTKHDISEVTTLFLHLVELMHMVRIEVQSEIDHGVIQENRIGSRWVARVIETLRRIIANPNDESLRFITWYRSANELKKNGFYLDWMDGDWKDPKSATSEQFAEYRGYADWFVRATEEVMLVPFEKVLSSVKDFEESVDRAARTYGNSDIPN